MSGLKGPLQLLNLPLQADLQNVVLLTAAIADLLACTLEFLASLVLGICELSLQQGLNAVSKAGSAAAHQGTLQWRDTEAAERGTAAYCKGAAQARWAGTASLSHYHLAQVGRLISKHVMPQEVQQTSCLEQRQALGTVA